MSVFPIYTEGVPGSPTAFNSLVNAQWYSTSYPGPDDNQTDTIPTSDRKGGQKSDSVEQSDRSTWPEQYRQGFTLVCWLIDWLIDQSINQSIIIPLSMTELVWLASFTQLLFQLLLISFSISLIIQAVTFHAHTHTTYPQQRSRCSSVLLSIQTCQVSRISYVSNAFVTSHFTRLQVLDLTLQFQ